MPIEMKGNINILVFKDAHGFIGWFDFCKPFGGLIIYPLNYLGHFKYR